MNTIKCILMRHSYRGEYTSESVPRKDLKLIMEAGLAAPSGCNKQTVSLVAVDDRKTLLLAAAYEHGTIHLHTIYVNTVLVERTASHVVLTAQLVVCAHAGLRCHKFLYGIAAGTGHSFKVFFVEFLHGPHLPACFGNSDFCHFFATLLHDDIERQVTLWLLEDTFPCLISNHAVDDHNTVGSVEGEIILSVNRSRSAKRLPFDADLTQ